MRTKIIVLGLLISLGLGLFLLILPVINESQEIIYKNNVTIVDYNWEKEENIINEYLYIILIFLALILDEHLKTNQCVLFLKR